MGQESAVPTQRSRDIELQLPIWKKVDDMFQMPTLSVICCQHRYKFNDAKQREYIQPHLAQMQCISVAPKHITSTCKYQNKSNNVKFACLS